MGHDCRGLPLYRYNWYVLSPFSEYLIGTLALLSRRFFVIHLWLSFHDSGPTLHRLPSNDRFLRICTWICGNATLYRSL